jgi:hypothetical protein
LRFVSDAALHRYPFIVVPAVQPVRPMIAAVRARLARYRAGGGRTLAQPPVVVTPRSGGIPDATPLLNYFASWYSWAVRSRIPPIADAARTFKRHFENIITYLRLRISNASAESLNAKIQWIKYQARGFRNEGRFQRAILFHCAGLDLSPAHSNP